MMEPIIKAYMTELNAQMEEDTLKVCHSYGIEVNRERLMQALTDARKFYDEGYLAGKLDAGPKWISVEDRLPEDFLADKDTKVIHCLVVLKPPRSQPKRKPLVTKAQRQWNSWTKSWEWGRVSGVIHWMPLPEPPKEG